jgi:hypothetical protein
MMMSVIFCPTVFERWSQRGWSGTTGEHALWSNNCTINFQLFTRCVVALQSLHTFFVLPCWVVPFLPRACCCLLKVGDCLFDMDLADNTCFDLSASKFCSVLWLRKPVTSRLALGKPHWESLSVSFREFSGIVIIIIINSFQHCVASINIYYLITQYYFALSCCWALLFTV